MVKLRHTASKFVSLCWTKSSEILRKSAKPLSHRRQLSATAPAIFYTSRRCRGSVSFKFYHHYLRKTLLEISYRYRIESSYENRTFFKMLCMAQFFFEEKSAAQKNNSAFGALWSKIKFFHHFPIYSLEDYLNGWGWIEVMMKQLPRGGGWICGGVLLQQTTRQLLGKWCDSATRKVWKQSI